MANPDNTKEIEIGGQQMAGPSDAQLLSAGVDGIKGFVSGAVAAVKGFFRSGAEKAGQLIDSAREGMRNWGSSSPTPPPKEVKPAQVSGKPMQAGPSDQQLLSAGLKGVTAIATGAYSAVKHVVAPEKPAAVEDVMLSPRIQHVAVTNLNITMEVDGRMRKFDIPESTAEALRSGRLSANELANAILDKIDAAQRRVGTNYSMLMEGIGDGVSQNQGYHR